VEVELYNDLPTDLKPEPFAPEVPLERRDRLVSRQVSLHADLLLTTCDPAMGRTWGATRSRPCG
jgi:hypothetical protein